MNNQYPEYIIDRLKRDTLNEIFEKKETVTESEKVDEEEEKKMVMIEYSGMKKLNTPCQIIFKLKKLKSVLPSLKPFIDKSLKSGIVYKILCPRCSLCYVGQTRRHLATRIREHGSAKAPVSIHMKSFGHSLSMDDVSILTTCTKSVVQLMTFEALFINQLKPELNLSLIHI